MYDTDLSRCTFVGAHNLDGLTVGSLTAFGWAPTGPLTRRWELRTAGRRRRWGEVAAAGSEHLLLWLYWAVSGYGLRAWRALAALLAVLLGGAVVLRCTGYPDGAAAYGTAVRLAVQAAMSLVRGIDEPLTAVGEWTTLALRLLGPLLFGLALLALRGRVRR